MEFAALLAIHSRPEGAGARWLGCSALRRDGPAHPHSRQFTRSGVSFHDVGLGTYHVSQSTGLPTIKNLLARAIRETCGETAG